LGTIVMVFSYFPFVAAFTAPPGEDLVVDGGLVGIALAMAPFVFVVLALGSRNPATGRHVLIAMGLFLAVGLSVGLVAPALGIAAGFGVGGTVALRRWGGVEVLRWRLSFTAVGVVYTFALLVIVTPAGVFSGGLLPLILLGFADEFAAWRQATR